METKLAIYKFLFLVNLSTDTSYHTFGQVAVSHKCKISAYVFTI